MEEEAVIRSCLYNWIGYGNLNAKTWFIGKEEGGKEFSKKGNLTLVESLGRRTKFDIAMDFKTVWNDLYKYQDNEFIEKGHSNVWRFIAAFYLYQSEGIDDYLTQKRNIDAEIDEFLKIEFGRVNGDVFLCEFMPLPLPTSQKGRLPELYRKVWDSRRDYEDEVMPRRFELIMRKIRENNNIKRIVCFDSRFIQKLLFEKDKLVISCVMEWQADNKNEGKYSLYSMKLDSNRTISVLQTPFFGPLKLSVGSYRPQEYWRRGLPFAARI